LHQTSFFGLWYMIVVGLPSSVQYQTEVSGLDIGGPCISAAAAAAWALLHHQQSITGHINKSSYRPYTSAKENLIRIRVRIWIRTLYLDYGSTWDDLQKLTETSLFKVTFVVKFFVKIRSPFQGYACKLWKNVLSRSVEESFKKFLDPDPEANDFQNLTNSSLSKDT